ncbi:hypothetical protein LJB92_04445 [Bacteroidales bacterium OttesenSCG-928-M06]|nr:hypothetical protein [Bacteroidales bacterium OttesenSCG-928-M06]
MKKTFLLGSLLLFSQCINDHLSRGFDLYNNSGKPISYYMPRVRYISYPDTTLPLKSPNPYMFNKEWHFSFGDIGYHENDFFEGMETDTISIFFFDPDTLAAYDWSIIRNEYKILVRYDLSHSDLRYLEWEIYYPPTEKMKDIKMFPPYESFN